MSLHTYEPLTLHFESAIGSFCSLTFFNQTCSSLRNTTSDKEEIISMQEEEEEEGGEGGGEE
jgi:hypothetical protein